MWRCLQVGLAVQAAFVFQWVKKKCLCGYHESRSTFWGVKPLTIVLERWCVFTFPSRIPGRAPLGRATLLEGESLMKGSSRTISLASKAGGSGIGDRSPRSPRTERKPVAEAGYEK